MFRIGVLVSGGGTNLQAIIDRIEDGYLENCKITSVVSSKEGAFALERAKKHGVSAVCMARKSYANTEEYSRALAEHFKAENVDLIVLAGFLTVLSEEFISNFENKIINAEINNQNPLLVTLEAMKEILAVLKEQQELIEFAKIKTRKLK